MSICIVVFIIFTRLPPVGGVESTDASSIHHNIQLLKTRRYLLSCKKNKFKIWLSLDRFWAEATEPLLCPFWIMWFLLFFIMHNIFILGGLIFWWRHRSVEVILNTSVQVHCYFWDKTSYLFLYLEVRKISSNFFKTIFFFFCSQFSNTNFYISLPGIKICTAVNIVVITVTN